MLMAWTWGSSHGRKERNLETLRDVWWIEPDVQVWVARDRQRDRGEFGKLGTQWCFSLSWNL